MGAVVGEAAEAVWGGSGRWKLLDNSATKSSGGQYVPRIRSHRAKQVHGGKQDIVYAMIRRGDEEEDSD